MPYVMEINGSGRSDGNPWKTQAPNDLFIQILSTFVSDFMYHEKSFGHFMNAISCICDLSSSLGSDFL